MKLEHIQTLIEDVDKLHSILTEMRTEARIIEGQLPRKVSHDEITFAKNELDDLQKQFDCWQDNYSHDIDEWLKTTEKAPKQQSEVFKQMAEIFRPINQL